MGGSVVAKQYWAKWDAVQMEVKAINFLIYIYLVLGANQKGNLYNIQQSLYDGDGGATTRRKKYFSLVYILNLVSMSMCMFGRIFAHFFWKLNGQQKSRVCIQCMYVCTVLLSCLTICTFCQQQHKKGGRRQEIAYPFWRKYKIIFLFSRFQMN